MGAGGTRLGWLALVSLAAVCSTLAAAVVTGCGGDGDEGQQLDSAVSGLDLTPNATRATLQKRRRMVEGVVRALRDGTESVLANPEPAVKEIARAAARMRSSSAPARGREANPSPAAPSKPPSARALGGLRRALRDPRAPPGRGARLRVRSIRIDATVGAVGSRPFGLEFAAATLPPLAGYSRGLTSRRCPLVTS